MSMIEGQVKELRYVANGMEIGSYDESILIDMFNKAADTIESLYAKLQTEYFSDKWIPCSERLPEFGKRYFVTAVWKDGDFEKKSVYDAVYGSDGIWHTHNYEPVSYEVIAWQPLMEVYDGKNKN